MPGTPRLKIMTAGIALLTLAACAEGGMMGGGPAETTPAPPPPGGAAAPMEPGAAPAEPLSMNGADGGMGTAPAPLDME